MSPLVKITIVTRIPTNKEIHIFRLPVVHYACNCLKMDGCSSFYTAITGHKALGQYYVKVVDANIINVYTVITKIVTAEDRDGWGGGGVTNIHVFMSRTINFF